MSHVTGNKILPVKEGHNTVGQGPGVQEQGAVSGPRHHQPRRSVMCDHAYALFSVTASENLE